MEEKRKNKETYKQKYKIVKHWRNYFIVLFVAILFTATGIRMNHAAFMSNDCKMPVYKSNVVDDIHFGFWNKEEVNNFLLVDYIRIGDRGIYSLGDLFQYASPFILVVYLYCYSLSIYRIYRKWKKKTKNLSKNK